MLTFSLKHTWSWHWRWKWVGLPNLGGQFRVWVVVLALWLLIGELQEALDVHRRARAKAADLNENGLEQFSDVWSLAQSMGAYYQVMALGQRLAVSDGLMMRSFLDSETRGVAGNLLTASVLDPSNFELHYRGALYISLFARDHRAAQKLLERAEAFRLTELPDRPVSFIDKSWSGAWWIPLELAYLHIFEFDNMKLGAHYLRQAAEAPRSPAYLKSLSLRLSDRLGLFQVGEKLLRFLILSAEGQNDAVQKRQLEGKLRDLIITREIYLINKEWTLFREINEKDSLGLAARTENADGIEERFGVDSGFSVGQKALALFAQFRAKKGLPARDPWGGEWTLDLESGRIGTSVKVEKVFKL